MSLLDTINDGEYDMTKITIALMMFLALLGAIYSVDRILKRNNVRENRHMLVTKWLIIAYLPIVIWLPLSLTIFSPLLSKGVWFLITHLLGIAWTILAFVSFRKKYPN